jgi:hypothetical protein
LTDEERKALAEFVRNANGGLRVGTIAENRVELTLGSRNDAERSN